MKTAMTVVLAAVFFMASMSLGAQIAPVCDSGGVCGTDPNPTTNPSYGGLLAARPQVQNARGTRNPTVAVSGAPGTVPIVIGSQSYNKVFPLVSLPGRGLDLNLAAYYNSRIWDIDTANSAVSFNADRDWPTYGFRIDFGFMEYDANNAQFILTESDGTKHAMPITANTTNGSIFDSNDGTSIEFNNQSLILIYGNGTTVKYQAFPSQATLFRPIQVKDRNGNYITINYLTGTGNDQHIDTVVDTLGRVIKFVYDGANHLSQITQAVDPNTDPSGTHVWATFNWAQVPFAYSFSSSLSVLSSPATGSSIWVLTGCSFANLTGYKFSYGAWGIINRIDQLSSTGLVRSYETYNYPDASQPLNDAPRYTSMTISPDGTATSQWNYAETQSARGQVTSQTITDPLGTSTVSTLNTNGTLKSVQLTDSTGKIFRTAVYTWTTTAPARTTSVATTDDAGNQSSISYVYDVYGNVTDFGENDFGGQNIRHTVTAYKQAPYTTNHIFNLQQSVQVKDSGGTLRQRTDFDYDQTSPAALSAVLHNDTSITTPRGNLTSITRYPDVATLANPISRNLTYDSTGNVITAEIDCCTKKRFNFDPSSQYAYLSSVVSGPDNGQQFTLSTSFNADNGLKVSSTDENGQQTSYVYDNMYRVKTVNTPPSNGIALSQTTSYGDDVVAPTVTNSASANSAKMAQTFDGLGHVLRQDMINSSSDNTVSTTQFQYDPIWRRKATSNPYAPGESLLWNNTAYDAEDRVVSITPPSGGSTQFVFTGNTVTITDPAGKQRKNFVDGLGRLVRVDEPGWGDALSAVDSVSISGVERSKFVSNRVCVQWDLRGRCIQWELDTSINYDTGTVTATIGGVGYSYNYGQTDTSASVAQNLALKINNDPNRVVNASPSGSTINFQAVSPGASGNSISVSASSVTSDTADFAAGSTSFPVSTFTPTLNGGENAVSQANAVLTATRHLTTTYTYDVLDHLLTVSQGAVGPINGQQLAGQPRSYVYDGIGRIITSTTPEAGTVTYYYTTSTGSACSGDPSAVCRKLDARNITATLSYADSNGIADPLNRLRGVTYSDTTPAVTYLYDTGGQPAFALGRLTEVDESGNSQMFAYDNLGRVTSLTYTIDGMPYPVQYTYNSANQMTGIVYPSNRTLNVAYDPIGRLNQLTDTNNLNNPYVTVNSADYNGAGEVKNLTLGNGVKGALIYNDRLQMSALRYFNPTAPGGTPDILNLGYDYGTTNNGQIRGVHYYTSPNVEDSTKSETFTYDAWLHLSAAQTNRMDSTPGTWGLQWTYDRLGNRLSQTPVGGNVSLGQSTFLIDETTNHLVGFSYDNTGNLIADPAFTYIYDGVNRMKQAQQVGLPNTTTASTYLGGLRIKKVIGPANGPATSSTVYVYAGTLPIAEYLNGSTTPSKEYIYAGSDLLATVAGTTITYHHPDHLSNRAETDGSGALVRTFGHFPYGETWYETPGTDKRKFTSYERDSGPGETGLDYAMFRYYNPGQGRFMSPDFLAGSIANPQKLNRYSYGNDPINSVDPLGLDQVSVQMVGNCMVTTYYTYTTVISGPDAKGVFHGHSQLVATGVSLLCFGGGGPSIGPAGDRSGGCVGVSKFQRAGIAIQGVAASFWNKTIGLGLGGSASAGNIVGTSFSLSRQLVVSPNGQAAYVNTITDVRNLPFNAAVTPGAGALAGNQFSFSNAQTPQDLAGPFVDIGGSFAAGLGAGGNYSVGAGTQGQVVHQFTFTAGFGLGGRGAAFTPTVSFVTPICP
jgi:RHS repeat-associated protein